MLLITFPVILCLHGTGVTNGMLHTEIVTYIVPGDTRFDARKSEPRGTQSRRTTG